MTATPEETVWHEIGQALNTLPPESRHRQREAIRRWIHDVGHNVGLIVTSVGLLRRESRQTQHALADEELLGILEEASGALQVLLLQIRQLPEAIDDSEDPLS